MKIHLSEPFLTRQRHLWRVPQFTIRQPQLRRLDLGDLGHIRFLSRDEDALVAFWPGQPLRCYQCGVTSDDPNPTYERLIATEGNDYGLPPFGCEHIEQVTDEIERRCRRGER